MSRRTELFRQISELVDEVFGNDAEVIEEWWITERSQLGGACPLEMLYSIPEMEALLVYITQVNYGVYT